MSHDLKTSLADSDETRRIKNSLYNLGYNAEFSRRAAIKAALAVAGSAVLFGLPGRAHAARATQQTLDALASAEEKLAAVQAEMDAIAAEFQALSIEQDKTISKIEGVQGQIDDTQIEIDQKQEELEGKQDVLAGRVTDSYKDGPGSFIKLLLSAKSFDEFLSNSRYVEKINDADKQVIDEVREIREELGKKKQELEGQKADLETLKQQQAEQLSVMQAKQAEVQDLVDGLSSDVKSSCKSATPSISLPLKRRGASSKPSSSINKAAEPPIFPATRKSPDHRAARPAWCPAATPSPALDPVSAPCGSRASSPPQDLAIWVATPTTCTTAGARAPTRASSKLA